MESGRQRSTTNGRIIRRSILALSLAAAALAVAGVLPDRAGAATQLGQTSPVDPTDCGSPLNTLQSQAASASYTVPFPGGVITGWSHRGGDGTAGSGRLQLWGPASGSNYTLVGRSALHNFTAGVVNVFATRIPVNGGELLGLRSGSVDTGCFHLAGAGDIVLAALGTDPAPGETRTMNSTFNALLVNVAAVLEPDADGDGFGDESQDQCLGQAGPNSGCPPSNEFGFGKLKKNKKKGTAKLEVDLPGPGDVELAKTKKVKGKEKSAEGEGTVKLPIKPRGKAKKKLNQKGKTKVKAKVTYTPDGGEPSTQSKKVGLKKR